MSDTSAVASRASAPAQKHPNQPAAEPRLIRPLPNSQENIWPMNISEGSRGNLWGAKARIGDDIDDMLQPRYWDMVAEKVKPDDVIKMHFPGNDRWEFFAVRDVWRTGNALVPNHADIQHLPQWSVPLRPVSRDGRVENFATRYDGDRQGWSLWDTLKNIKVGEGFPSREDAEARARQLTIESLRKQNISPRA